jgi:hypothetical protein
MAVFMDDERTFGPGTGAAAHETTADPSGGVTEQLQRWYAYCDRVDHPGNKIWTGAKRSSRREAIKDSVEHNKKFSHNSVVRGPLG